MISPESLVLVGVIKRKRDLKALLEENWYRIPEGNAPRGIYADVLAFFQSGKVFKEQNGGIHYFAERRGVELAYRKDLLPDEAQHKRANQRYHKIQLGPITDKTPPIINKPNPYRFAFIYTTWDRFRSAIHIRDLYSQSDYFVDRVFHALRQNGIQPNRQWEAVASNHHEAQTFAYEHGAALRILCENGSVLATTNQDVDEGNTIFMNSDEDSSQAVSDYLKRIKEEINRLGGTKTLDIPLDPI